jgi:hypothetical protein
MLVLIGGKERTAQIENRSSGFRGRIQIDCLNVLDDVGVTGIGTSSNLASIPVGSDAFVAVQDNREGPTAPADEITLGFSGLGIPCTFVTDPALLAPFSSRSRVVRSRSARNRSPDRRGGRRPPPPLDR